MTATTLSDRGLSVAGATVADMPRHHPWREMRALPEWSVHYAPSLPWGAHGWTRWGDRTVWLRSGLTQVERRCALAHELEHVRRGPEGQGEHEEAAVEQATARALISISSSSRRSCVSALESSMPTGMSSGSRITAPAETGPAHGPRPASSTPQTGPPDD